jgi:hypothetical protein
LNFHEIALYFNWRNPETGPWCNTHVERGHHGEEQPPSAAEGEKGRCIDASTCRPILRLAIPVVPLHGRRSGCCTCGDSHCKRPGKHPRTELDIADATIDPTEIRGLWKKWPNAKIGIVMGWPGKLMALMTDGPEARQTLQAIATTQGKVPRTVIVRDNDRRFHLFEVDGKPPRSWDLANGLRIIGDADFIIAPSTLSDSHNERRFAKCRAPGQVKIAKAPRWLLEKRAASSSGQAAGESQQGPVQSKPARSPSNGDGDSGLVMTSAAEVPQKDVEWLWPGRIALGKLTVISGHPNLGKSQLAAYLAAIVSTGREWPCGEGRAPLGRVILLMAEDDASDTIVPRLKVANADLSRIHFVEACDQEFDLLAEMQTLEQKVHRFGDVRLIIIDPITAFSKSVRRPVANRLQQLAAGLDAAVVVVSHFSKTVRAGALMRVMGSLDLVAVARAAFIVVDEQGTDRRLFLPAKNNIAAA